MLDDFEYLIVMPLAVLIAGVLLLAIAHFVVFFMVGYKELFK